MTKNYKGEKLQLDDAFTTEIWTIYCRKMTGQWVSG